MFSELNNIFVSPAPCGATIILAFENNSVVSLKDNSIHIKYKGIDFSEHFIKTAKTTWNSEDFYVDSFRNLNDDFSNKIIYASGLLDILVDGIKELDIILSYKAKYVLLSRIEIGTKQVSSYKAYGIEIIRYVFDKQEILSKIHEKNYKIIKQIGTSYLLELDI